VISQLRSNKIAVKQATLILFTSLVFGVMSAMVQMFFDLNEERTLQAERIARSIHMVLEPTQRAIYNLDRVAAGEILTDLTGNPLIKKASLYDDFGDLLAVNQRSPIYSSNLLNRLSILFFDIPLEQSVRIAVHSDRQRFAVLNISIDEYSLGQGVARRIYIALGGTIVITVLLSIIFLVIGYHFFSKPIVQIEQWVKGLKESQDAGPSPYRSDDELGSLVTSFRQVWSDNKSAANQLNRLVVELTMSEQFSRLVMENSNDAMFLCLANTSIYQVNQQAELLLCSSSHELSGMSLADFSLIYSADQLGTLFAELSQEDCRTYEDTFTVKDSHSDQRRFIECRAGRFQHAGRDFILINARDVTERKYAEQQIHQLAYYDSLTKLANRRMLLDGLKQQIADYERSHRFGIVMYFDLDRFKNINDSMGHSVGDQILCVSADRIKRAVPSDAICGRLGGDEFVIAMPNFGKCRDEAAFNSLTLAKQLLDVLAEPIEIKDMSLHITTSIGLALFPSDSLQAEELVTMADTAMYRAKALGRNSIQFYDREMQSSASYILQVEEGIHQALRLNHFEVWMQPQTDAEGDVVGAEVLLRWNDPQKGIVMPGDFIPHAEESGQIVDIDKWVLKQSVAILSQWLAQGFPHSIKKSSFKKLAINVSPIFFQQVDFVSYITSLLEEYQVSGELIELEITENMLLNNFEIARSKMALLKQHGITFAIDDFGTGYSSLRYLNELPLTVLKIDRSFIEGITDGSDTIAIVEVIIATAKKLGLDVVAEGVETEEQLTCLKSLGCYHYQGYFFGKPMHNQLFFEYLNQKDVK
jgi:diguanylate cyclase (GGDEF)-like protein/PAS domain S-box-containing protein